VQGAVSAVNVIGAFSYFIVSLFACREKGLNSPLCAPLGMQAGARIRDVFSGLFSKNPKIDRALELVRR
jgi:hypothetical protein